MDGPLVQRPEIFFFFFLTCDGDIRQGTAHEAPSERCLLVAFNERALKSDDCDGPQGWLRWQKVSEPSVHFTTVTLKFLGRFVKSFSCVLLFQV